MTILISGSLTFILFLFLFFGVRFQVFRPRRIQDMLLRLPFLVWNYIIYYKNVVFFWLNWPLFWPAAPLIWNFIAKIFISIIVAASAVSGWAETLFPVCYTLCFSSPHSAFHQIPTSEIRIPPSKFHQIPTTSSNSCSWNTESGGSCSMFSPAV